MKKFLLTIICMAFCILQSQAQTDTVMYITEMNGGVHNICFNRHERAIVIGPSGCGDPNWLINYNQQFTGDSIILDGNNSGWYSVQFSGWNCGQYSSMLYFKHPTTPCESTEKLWIHGGELAELQAVEADSASMYDIHWNTGEEENIIYKPAGTYIAGISDMCATAYRTKIVKESVEIDLATCDLESNLNLVTWPTTVAQAQYIDHVIVKRDGLQVGTADYSDGQFTDNIGSGAASRTYTIVAVATDGTECPIVSYPKETIHMSYTLGMNNTIEIGRNTPTGYDLLGYNICEWHEDDGSLTVIDFVGASVTSYTCSQSQFDEGYIVVQGVEAAKDGEMRLLSNRSMDLVGLGENEATAFKVYPNPANGILFVETRRATSLPEETYRIVNPIGQTMMEGQITMEKQQIDVRNLSNGLYFITIGGATRKFVVE